MVDLFSALRGMFKPIVANSQVAVVFEEPTDVPRLYTDDKKLSQILRNYISNALKFTLAGEVRVRAVLNEGDTVTFTVQDTGIGIAREQLAHLFEEFVQVGTPLQTHVRGTGLGLALSRRFAELLGGRVFADSELGRGSTFGVTIPVRLPEQPHGG
jgi:signal transduction histidine kinase